MNNHDELSYIKIVTRILEEMSRENDKIRRELLINRIVLLAVTICLVLMLLGVI